MLTKDSDFTLPSADQHESVTTSGGNWPYPIVTNPDQPAVIVERGATLQYGTDGSTGIIGDYPYTSISGVTLNHDNIQVDGTLDLDIANREYNLGTISGSGLISQPRNTWGTLDLADDLPFTGTIADGTGFNFGSAASGSRCRPPRPCTTTVPRSSVHAITRSCCRRTSTRTSTAATSTSTRGRPA